MNRAAFSLDLDRCTGCSACAFACRIENELPPGGSFREVTTFNPARLAGAPVVHLSLACNHCEKPTCLRGCPAGAYTRDTATGAIVLHQERCIGCTYCAWVCPYEAPRFDRAAGVMAKCTFCLPRLERGEEPACVRACPVDALNLIWREMDQDAAAASSGIPGFPDAGTRPALTFGPGRRRLSPRPASEEDAAVGQAATASGSRATGLGLRTEWPLAVFSLLCAVLVAWFVAGVLGGPAPRSFVFLALATGALGVSSLHLGRPVRMWRAARNVATSWVSREAVLVGAFFAMAAVVLVFRPAIPWLPPLAALVGVLALCAMDMVYRVRGMVIRALPHSAMTTLTAAYATGLLLGWPWLAGIGCVIKLALYLSRWRARWRREGLGRQWTPIARIGLGLLAPALARPESGAPLGWAVFACFLVGEGIDRAEFYAELGFLTPRRQADRDLSTTCELARRQAEAV